MKYQIRVGGSNDYVSKIDPNDRLCSPPGSVDFIAGRHGALVFDNHKDAQASADQVGDIEGVHTSVERFPS